LIKADLDLIIFFYKFLDIFSVL